LATRLLTTRWIPVCGSIFVVAVTSIRSRAGCASEIGIGAVERPRVWRLRNIGQRRWRTPSLD
jgi:hypothetical protein